MDGIEEYPNQVQQELNEAFAWRKLTAIIASRLYTFIN